MDFIYDMVIRYGYYGLFLWTLVDGTGIPNPVQLAFIASGYLIMHGVMSPYITITVATLGNLTGNIIAYYAGFYEGRSAIERYGRYLHIDDEDIRKVDQWFSRYGGLTNMVSRWIGITRTPAIWAAGITRMSVRTFAVYSFVGDLVWAVFLTYFSYVFSMNINVFLTLPLGIKITVSGLVACIVILSWVVFLRYYKKK